MEFIVGNGYRANMSVLRMICPFGTLLPTGECSIYHFHSLRSFVRFFEGGKGVGDGMHQNKKKKINNLPITLMARMYFCVNRIRRGVSNFPSDFVETLRNCSQARMI